MSNYVEAGRRPFGGGTRDEAPRLNASQSMAVDAPRGLERATWMAYLAFVAFLQVSIFASELLLSVTAVLWVALLIRRRECFDAPPMFWPLAAYAAATLVSAAFSVDSTTSLIRCKQLLLFAIVPITWHLMPGRRAMTVVDIIITVGAVSATIGIVQFGILKWDDLGQRPRGSLGLYMTYSGQLMLVACTAAARILFRNNDRVWASLVMPALLVALAVTLSRNGWVGACVGIGFLFVIRDFRLLALLPVVAAVFIAFAPTTLTDRLYSTFHLNEVRRGSATTISSTASNQDRVAMFKSGLRIIKDHPLIGVGPDMVPQVYPHYRGPGAINQLNSHLHNVPLQIAAERGLPALAIWLWFIVTLLRDFFRMRKTSAYPSLPTAALACVLAILAAGMFEHNFGDSEILMLFLVLVTLPYAADRTASGPAGSAAGRPLA